MLYPTVVVLFRKGHRHIPGKARGYNKTAQSGDRYQRIGPGMDTASIV